MQHHVPHAQGAGAKAAVRSRQRQCAFPQGLTMKNFDAIARRIQAPRHCCHAAQRQFFFAGAGDEDAGGFECVYRRLQLLRIDCFEAKKRGRIGVAALHQHALATLVHAQRERIRVVLDHLHRQHVGAELAPGVEIARLHSAVSQSDDRHGFAP